MRVNCPKCGLSGQMDDARIPGQGGHLTCPRCKERFFVAKEASPPAPSPVAAPPPRAAEKSPAAVGVASAGAHDEGISFVRKLERETAAWQDEGLIDAGQRDRIMARYRRLREVEEKAGPGRLVTVISVLGSILVGVGILLFISSNWSEIPRWGKLAIIFSAMLGSYGVGYRLRYEGGNFPKVGASLIFLGTVIFGGGIFLVAQIFHVSVHYPNGPLMWGLAILPLAYLLRFKSILTLAIGVLLVWLGTEAGFHLEGEYGYSGLAMISLFLAAGLLLWGVGLAHRGAPALRDMAAPWLQLGVAVTFLCAFFLTFAEVFRHWRAADGLIPFLGVMGVLFCGAVLLRARLREPEKGWKAEILILCAAMAGVIYLATGFTGVKTEGVASAVAIVANLIYAAGLIGIIVLGYLRRMTAYINLGLIFFVIDIIARYVDFFWKLLPRSLFFIAGGLILLAGGVFLERKRRSVIESFHKGEVA